MDIELREILNKVKSGEMQPDEAQWKICVLFSGSVCYVFRDKNKCEDFQERGSYACGKCDKQTDY